MCITYLVISPRKIHIINKRVYYCFRSRRIGNFRFWRLEPTVIRGRGRYRKLDEKGDGKGGASVNVAGHFTEKLAPKIALLSKACV